MKFPAVTQIFPGVPGGFKAGVCEVSLSCPHSSSPGRDAQLHRPPGAAELWRLPTPSPPPPTPSPELDCPLLLDVPVSRWDGSLLWLPSRASSCHSWGVFSREGLGLIRRAFALGRCSGSRVLFGDSSILHLCPIPLWLILTLHLIFSIFLFPVCMDCTAFYLEKQGKIPSKKKKNRTAKSYFISKSYFIFP